MTICLTKGEEYINTKTKFELVEERLEELVKDYGNTSIKYLEEKYGASYGTIQRVLKKHGYIQGNKNYKYVYIHEHMDEFIKDYIDGILTEKDLEEKYQCPQTCFTSLARDLSIKRKRLSEKIDMDNLISDWKSKTMYDYEICNKYNISYSTLLKFLSENHVDGLGERCGRKDFFNEKHFDNIDTEHKAYWLGFVYADGSHNEQRYSLTITLKDSDSYILEEFFKDVGSNKSVSKIFNKQYEKYYASARVQHPHLSKTLLEKGVPSDKSFKIIFPNDDIVPYEYKWHFIRGYFDGDGGLSVNKNNSSKVNLSIAGNHEFLSGMKSFIENEIPNFSININKHARIFTLNKGGRFTIERLLNYIYKDATIYLKRKHDIYMQILSKNRKDKVV